MPQVAHSFLAALRNDERVNYQLDVKFQESYLKKMVDLLHCQLSEGSVSDVHSTVANSYINGNDKQTIEEVEEGELPCGHGKHELLF